jgi:hypothetical protein
VFFILLVKEVWHIGKYLHLEHFLITVVFFVSAWWVWAWKRSTTVRSFTVKCILYKLTTNKHIDLGDIFAVSVPTKIGLYHGFMCYFEIFELLPCQGCC